MAIILPYNHIQPVIAQDAFIAPNATIIGDVTIGNQAGIWFGCIIRGDVAEIRIGARTNIQDGTVIHVTRNHHPTIIGTGVTIGHHATLHACTLEDHCFIGMRAIVLDDAIVESGAMLAAGALLTPGKQVKKGQIWAGNPARYFRDLTEDETRHITQSEKNYVKHAEEYRDII